MKKLITFVIGVVILFPSISQTQAFISKKETTQLSKKEILFQMKTKGIFNQIKKEKQNYVPDEVIIKYKDDKIQLTKTMGKIKAFGFATMKGLSKKEELKGMNVAVYGVKSDETVEDAVKRLSTASDVEYVQPNFVYELLDAPEEIPNDPMFEQQWGLHNIGQSINEESGTVDADVDMPEGHDSFSKSENVVVAVIDTGISYDHPDLMNQMWDGTDQCVDHEGNVIAEGCPNHGWYYTDDTETDTNDPFPTDDSHGTHVAGIIAAEKNNEIGISGVGEGIELMALKTDLTTIGNAKAVEFASNNGARVINASWGAGFDNCDFAYDQMLYEAIENFDGLFIAASGNSGQDHDLSDFFDLPSDYGKPTGCWEGLDNIISIAATDNNDNKASFSDYGNVFVDIGAPGEDILSTVIGEPVVDIIESQDFEEITPPTIPEEYEQTGNWGTQPEEGYGNVIYGDLNQFPYTANINSLTLLVDTDIKWGPLVCQRA